MKFMFRQHVLIIAVPMLPILVANDFVQLYASAIRRMAFGHRVGRPGGARGNRRADLPGRPGDAALHLAHAAPCPTASCASDWRVSAGAWG